MIELKEVLAKSLMNDSCMSVTIHCAIPELILRVTDSRQMFIYGVGLEKQQGFTLNIGIDKNSNKGKKIKEKLIGGRFLTDFKTFEDKRSMIYLKDFRQDTELLEKVIHDLLNTLGDNRSGQFYKLTVNRTDGNYTIE